VALSIAYVFIVHETSLRYECMIMEEGTRWPTEWKTQGGSWKLIGEEKLIRQCLTHISVNAVVKTIVVRDKYEINVDLKSRSLRFSGERLKRVMIVDDSMTMRKILKHLIEKIPGWSVVAELDSASKLNEKLVQFFPDLVTLDLNMEGMNGAEAMRQILSPKRVPTVVISSQPKTDGSLVMDALAFGALDYLQKPESGSWEGLLEELTLKLDSSLKAKWAVPVSDSGNIWKPIPQKFTSFNHLIVIGSSTGGTQALQEILYTLPELIPPILITQHIPPLFSRALAERFNRVCPFEVKEAEEGDLIKPNRVLIAPGGHHMRVHKSGKQVMIEDDDPINRFRPSVDALFFSVAENYTGPVIAMILTGMGKDGAQGLLELRRKGAHTVAQDEKSSVVFGMPKEAIRIQAAQDVISLNEMSSFLVLASNKLKTARP
jgi:two-component system chemotaxis response regulator CheB